MAHRYMKVSGTDQSKSDGAKGEGETKRYWSEQRVKSLSKDLSTLRDALIDALRRPPGFGTVRAVTKGAAIIPFITVHLVSDDPYVDAQLTDLQRFINPIGALLQIGAETSGGIDAELLNEFGQIVDVVESIVGAKSEDEARQALNELQVSIQRVRDYAAHREEFQKIGSPRDYSRASRSSYHGDNPRDVPDRVRSRGPSADPGGRDRERKNA
jgi:hypothetical protein